MRVLAIHRYYWPDTPPYASILRAIVAQWHTDGHRVEVLSSQPSYKLETSLERRPRREVVDDATVQRISMKPDRAHRLQRLVNMVRFPVLAALRVLLGPRRDVVMCSTAPQVVLGALVSVAARVRGAKFIYHCMDIHPEIGALSGEFANPILFRFLRAVDTATCRRAAAIVVLSNDMRAALLKRDPSLGERIFVLNNFELPSFDDDDQPSPLPPPHGRVRVAFTGNIGRFQGLDAIASAALSEDPALDQLELVFMGEGAAKADIERIVAAAPVARQHRVRLLPHSAPAVAMALLEESDYGLVSLTPHVIRFAYPSKTATYLSRGVPLLVAVERDSELAALVEDGRIGHHLPVDGDLVTALVALVKAGPVSQSQRASARERWEQDFSAARQLPRWSRLLDEVENGSR